MTNHLKIGRDISEHATYMEHMLVADRLDDADQLAGLATKELTGGKAKPVELTYQKKLENTPVKHARLCHELLQTSNSGSQG